MNLDGLTEKRNRLGTVYYENHVGDIVGKVCSECGIVVNIENYSKSSGGLGGKHSWCNTCRKKYDDANKERKKEYYITNKERISEYKRNNHLKNREKHLEYYRSYYKDNREKQIKMATIWNREHKENHAGYRKKWEEKNKEKLTKYRLLYYVENREKERERKRIYKKINYDKVKLHYHLRRARKRNLPYTLTTKEYEETLEFFGNSCALTGEVDNVEKEHALPLSIGHGGTTFENCYPMANGLNQSKGNKNIFEWFEANRQRFELSQERFDKLIAWLASANAMTVEEYRDYVYWCHANPRSVDELEAK